MKKNLILLALMFSDFIKKSALNPRYAGVAFYVFHKCLEKDICSIKKLKENLFGNLKYIFKNYPENSFQKTYLNSYEEKNDFNLQALDVNIFENIIRKPLTYSQDKDKMLNCKPFYSETENDIKKIGVEPPLIDTFQDSANASLIDFNIATEYEKLLAKTLDFDPANLQGSPPVMWLDLVINQIGKNKKIDAAKTLSKFLKLMFHAQDIAFFLKAKYMTRRPTQFNQMVPLIGEPPFPGWVSGHSTFSSTAACFMMAEGLDHSGEIEAVSYNCVWDLAIKASNSRVFGGIHIRKDCEDGVELGKKIYNYYK